MGRRFLNGLPASGIRVLALSTNGIRNITNSKRAIHTPDDIAKLRIRVPQNGASVALFRSLGADPIALPYSQVYAALRAGRVDGQETLHQHLQWYILRRPAPSGAHSHQFEGLGLAVSERTWQSFNRSTQKIVADAAHEAAAFHRIVFEDADTTAFAKLQALGLRVSEPDVGAFKAKSRGLYRQLATVFSKELVRDVEKAAQT